MKRTALLSALILVSNLSLFAADDGEPDAIKTLAETVRLQFTLEPREDDDEPLSRLLTFRM